MFHVIALSLALTGPVPVAIERSVQERMGNVRVSIIEMTRTGERCRRATVRECDALVAFPEPGSRLGRPVRFILVAGGTRVGSVVTRLDVSGSAVISNRAIPRGENIEADGIEVVETELRGMLLDRLPTMTEVVGAQARRDLRAGEILTTAAVLNAAGITEIQSAAQAAEALRPLAGDLTFILFALGIIGTGLLAVPVLAGSAAYGVSEAFGWPATLEARAPDAVGFYSIIAAATVVGLALGYMPINPIQMLIWSAVLNGIVAVPIMAMMMVVVTRQSVMGRFTAKPTLAVFGWAGTALMAITVVALFWSLIG